MALRELVLASVVCSFGLIGCEANDGAAENAGEQLDEAGDEIQDAGEDTADAAKEACEEAKDNMDAEDKDC